MPRLVVVVVVAAVVAEVARRHFPLQRSASPTIPQCAALLNINCQLRQNLLSNGG
jgi:hypothetical protein